MTDSLRTRIRRLHEMGKLSAAEAAELEQQVAAFEASSTRTPATIDGENAHARFLRGDIDAAAFLRAVRARGVIAGALYGALMAFATAAALRWAGSALSLVGIGLAVFLAGGLMYGVGLYAFFLRPRARRLVRFMALLDGRLTELSGTHAGQCPVCGAENCQPSFGEYAVRNWRFNPGIAVLELVAGVAIPRDLRQCRECGSDFVACASCGRSASGAGRDRWSVWGHWSGLDCPHCAKPLPLVQNVITETLLPGRTPVRP
jgi:hypothetical protein